MSTLDEEKPGLLTRANEDKTLTATAMLVGVVIGAGATFVAFKMFT